MLTPEEQVKILRRNVINLISEEELIDKIRRKKVLNVKLGVDPSRPDLHLGHAVVLRKLREFQDLGHKVILIIGDFTGRIGDPSGRSKTRPMLSEEEIRENAKTYEEQAFKILDPEKTIIRFNGEWHDKMKFSDVIKLAAKYTVARMLERDDFNQRYRNNEPISIAEFLYPLAQAYDSVMIEADVELGGTDQLFNLLVGRKIQEEFGQEMQVVMTMPLIEGTDGHLKMSKSFDNYVAFTDTPKDMYGKLMSIPDTLIIKYMRLLTDIPEEEIKKYENLMKEEKINPRDVKMRLAYEVTKYFHGEEEAKKAQDEFIKVFQKKLLPEDMKEIYSEREIKVLDLVLKTNIPSSKSEAKRLIAQGGVKLNNNRLTDPFATISLNDGDILRVGKKNFFKIRISN